MPWARQPQPRLPPPSPGPSAPGDLGTGGPLWVAGVGLTKDLVPPSWNLPQAALESGEDRWGERVRAARPPGMRAHTIHPPPRGAVPEVCQAGRQGLSPSSAVLRPGHQEGNSGSRTGSFLPQGQKDPQCYTPPPPLTETITGFLIKLLRALQGPPNLTPVPPPAHFRPPPPHFRALCTSSPKLLPPLDLPSPLLQTLSGTHLPPL